MVEGTPPACDAGRCERDWREPQDAEIEAELPDEIRFNYDNLTREQHELLFADCSEVEH